MFTENILAIDLSPIKYSVCGEETNKTTLWRLFNYDFIDLIYESTDSIYLIICRVKKEIFAILGRFIQQSEVAFLVGPQSTKVQFQCDLLSFRGKSRNQQ